MPETDLGVASMVAERIRRTIASNPFTISAGKNRLDVTISIGLATLDTKGESIAEVLKRADQALYRAKRDGRNRVVSTAA
jgi:two-component system cell cycle response regulator